MTGAESRPRRGRQAEAQRNDRRVLDAAREVFATQGAGAPVSAVAERAGVGVGSLYRRYGSKTELLQHLCTRAMRQTIEAAEAALAVDDASTGLADYVRTCVELGAGALAPLAGSFPTTPQMWEISRRGRRLLEELVVRAQQAGDLRPDVTALDVAWLIELFGRHRPSPPSAETDNIRRRLVALALDGLRVRQHQPLPGTPPSSRHYEERWRATPTAEPTPP